MDEIHRFNKKQQDIFLPSIESGKLILIGATTENPSFSLNKVQKSGLFYFQALISRCRVIELQPLSRSDLLHILTRAITEDIYIQKSGVEPRGCIEPRRFFLARFWK